MHPLAATLIGISLVLAGSFPECPDPQFTQPPFTDPRAVDRDFPASMAALRIPSGGVEINGILLIAHGRGPHPTIVMLHGFPGYEPNLDLAHEIRRHGWNVLWFHYRGAWGSAGSFRFENLAEDAAAALRFVREAGLTGRHRIDPRTIVLIGHSAGGGVALATAARDEGLAGVVAIAAADPSILGSTAATPEGQAVVAKQLAAQLGPLQGATGESLALEAAAHRDDWRLELLAPGLVTKPILLVTGRRDALSPAGRNQGPLVAALKKAGASRLSEVELDADHSFSDRRIALANTVTSWLAQFQRKSGNGGDRKP
jgi:pimeloyl-ACP methyl ester carboxylesterase